MPTPSFTPAEESIEWAEGALSNYNEARAMAFRPDNTALVQEFDPIADLKRVKIKVSGEIPVSKMKRHAVEVLLHSRHSFDQVINLASQYITGRNSKRSFSNFPWSNSRSHFQDTRLTAIPRELWNAIAEQEPYPSGNGEASAQNLIRALANLSNNKHSIGFIIKPQGSMQGPGHITIPKGARRVILMNPNWCPMKQEAELYAYSGPDLDFGEQISPSLFLCLDVPGFPDQPEVGIAVSLFLEAAKRNLDLVREACRKLHPNQG